MNNEKLLEEMERRAKARHEYLLMDGRLNVLDIEEKITLKFEKRIGSLERSRTWLLGMIGGITFLWGKKNF